MRSSSISPRQRHWLGDPALYAGGLVAATIVSPVFIWNAEHDWASFAFQGGRGSPGLHLRPLQVIAMLLGEIAYLTPWIFAALVGALVAAARRARQGDDKRLFLLCLALPPIVVFTLTPLWGARGLPHWPMPGWFFAYPLMGAWLVEPWARRLDLRRWAIGTAALMAALAALVVWHSATGGTLAPVGGSQKSARSDARSPALDEARRRARAAAATGFRRDPQVVGSRQGRRWRSDPMFPSSSSRTIRAASPSLTIARALSAAMPSSSFPRAQAERRRRSSKTISQRFDPPQFVALGPRRSGRSPARAHSAPTP